ncbi:trypsin domain-containing protein [Phthorimaea operculella]|nr:trypsin domain-containing protein [Phthorimaea operculella]
MEISGILFIVLLVSACTGLDQHVNCTYRSEMFPDIKYKGYPSAGDLPLLNRKIIRGKRVTVMEHPYIVSIRRQLAHYLTGALINGNMIVTVAHPLVDVPVIELGVVLGQHLNDRGDSLYTVILIVVHQDFDRATMRADLALLKTYESLDFIDYKVSIKPVKSLFTESYRLGKSVSAFVTGWGRCDTTGRELCLPRASIYYRDEAADPILRSIHIHITADSPHCDSYRRHDINILEGMLCVGPARQEDHTCPCLGVPGAPLVLSGSLLGVLSWGFGCGYHTDLPLIYTDVRYYDRLLDVLSWGFGCGYHTDLPLIYTDVRYYDRWIQKNVAIIASLNQKKFGQMYEVTKLAIITEWLNLSTNNKEKHDHSSLEIQPWEIDKDLALVDGDIYDVRDFYGRQDYHQEKMNGYAMIRASLIQERREKLTKIKTNTTTTPRTETTEAPSDDSDYEVFYPMVLPHDNPFKPPTVPGVLTLSYTTPTKPLSDEEYY